MRRIFGARSALKSLCLTVSLVVLLPGLALAGVLIEQLGAAATPADTDLVPTVQGASPAKGQSLGAIAAYMAARSETLTNKTINCVSGNTCTLPGGGGGTSWTVQANKISNYTLIGSDAGTVIPFSTAQLTITLPTNTAGSVFASGKQFILANLSTDLETVNSPSASPLEGIPTSGVSTITGWVPAGGSMLVTIDASGNYFAQYLASPLGALHSSGSASLNLNPSNCLVTYVMSLAATATIPTGLPVGCHAEFIQGGTGAVTLSAGSGFTLTSPHSYTHTFAQGSTIGVIITSSTTGVFYGDGA